MSASVVFIHGLWIHSVSWQPWQELFDKQGYRTLAPGWPGDGDTVGDTRAHPERVAGVRCRCGHRLLRTGHQGAGRAADRGRALVRGPDRPEAAGPGTGRRGRRASRPHRSRASGPCRSACCARASRCSRTRATGAGPSPSRPASSPTPSATRSLRRSLRSCTATSRSRPRGVPLFEVSTANFRRSSPTAVDTRRADRGPLLLIANGKDHTVPAVVVRGAHQLYARGGVPAELRTYEDRGHSAPFDHGWRELADDTLGWLDAQGLAP